jgi:glycosyltransferase involved in cell wall biosynthesis
VSTVTRGFIEHFRARGIEDHKLTFLPNGADTEFLKPQSPSAALRQRWGLGDRKVFAYVGTHAFYHGLETVIEAARRLSHRTDIAFLFVGAGPERERLREMARDLPNVVFGASPYEEMADLYSISYASIASLRNIEVAEGMRLSKIFPALSCGVPVIYSGRGEAADLLEKFDCGVAVPPEAPDALAQAVERLADDPGRRSRMGENGRRFVVENYSWSGIVGRWLAETGIVESSSAVGPPPAEIADGEAVPVRPAAAPGRAFPENARRSTAADR